MSVAATKPSGFASKWLLFQTAKHHVIKVNKRSDWTQIAINILKLLDVYSMLDLWLGINIHVQITFSA